MKPVLRLTLAIVLVGTLLAVLGTADLARLAARIDWSVAAVALLLVQAQIVLSAIRWRFTAGRLGLDVPFRRAVGEYYLSSLANMILPGGVAGDVLRTVRTTPGRTAVRAAVSAAVLERLSGQAAFWLIAATGAVLWAAGGFAAPAAALGSLAILPAVAGIVAAVVWAAARFGPNRVREALAGIGPDVRRALVADGALSIQASLSLAVAASYVAVFALAAAAVGPALDLLETVTLIPLVLLAMLIPISIGGWGVREGAAALLWPLAGLPAAEGVVAAALYGLIVVVGALPGLVVALAARPTASASPEAA